MAYVFRELFLENHTLLNKGPVLFIEYGEKDDGDDTSKTMNTGRVGTVILIWWYVWVKDYFEAAQKNVSLYWNRESSYLSAYGKIVYKNKYDEFINNNLFILRKYAQIVITILRTHNRIFSILETFFLSGKSTNSLEHFCFNSYYMKDVRCELNQVALLFQCTEWVPSLISIEVMRMYRSIDICGWISLSKGDTANFLFL